MRAFIALELPERFSDDLADMAQVLGLACGARLVPRENYHLTLAFLDEIDEAGARSAMAAIDAACEGRAPVALAAEGLGKFGKAHSAALWLAIAASEQVMELAADVRAELAARDVWYEDREFVPHVTLARRAKLPDAQLPSLAFPLPEDAGRVTLFRSYLEQTGAHYKALYSVELG